MAVMLALVSFSCGGTNASAKRVVLKWVKPFEPTENVQGLIQAYQTKHPNVRIEYTTTSDIDNYPQDLLNSLASGSGPDIFSINNNWLPQYIDKIVPTTEKQWAFKDYKETFVDAATADLTKDNKIYGVPLAVDSLGLYYNKDILGTARIALPPKTWDELSSDVRAITQTDSRGYFKVSGAALGTNRNINRSVDILYLFMLQKGAVAWSADGQNPTFDRAVQVSGTNVNAGVDALTYYTSFAQPQNPNYTWNDQSDYSIDAFANGRAAFLFAYSYAAATIAAKGPNINYDVALVPQPSLDGPRVDFANYYGEVVSKQSQNADWAWDFLKFISSKENLDKYYAVHKQPASRKDLIALQINDPQIGTFAHANLTAKTFYKPDQVKVDTIFGTMIDNVVLRGAAPRDALSQASQQAATLTRTR